MQANRHREETLVAVGAALLVLNLWIPYYRVIDDAYISYRYSQQLARGFGLVWNPGEAPVEGYTNFLLVLTEAPGIALGWDPLRIAQTLSVLSLLAGAWMLWRSSKNEPSAAPSFAAAVDHAGAH